MSTEPFSENLGPEGEACSTCGVALATDQRYCLNCGTARAEPRLDFQRILSPATAGATAEAAARPAAVKQWNPLAAVGAIAVLGVMLLLGVLIGKDDNETTVAAAPATTTTAAPVAAAPTEASAGAADKAAGKGGGKKDATSAGEGIQGGTGSTEGISTENPLEGLTGQDLVDAQKNSPDVIATDGEPPPVDNEAAGGGSGATCIGC